MGAPAGNKNATKNKPWEDAIRRALLANKGQKLRALAEKLIEKAEAGDMAALREIGDRIDGRPHQSISGPDGGPIEMREVKDDDLARWMAFEATQRVIKKAKAEA